MNEQQMTIDIRLPSIHGSEKEQLSQIRSYLYQTAQQLQFALGNITAQQDKVAQEVVKAAASSVAEKSPTAAFNSIKSLIIKSADIVDAYYEQINRRLESIYTAKSEFGAFKEEASQDIAENANGIERAFTNIQTVESALAEVQNQTLAVSAYVKTGLLYYDDAGFPVYGLEIGQENKDNGETVFNKYARFTSSRLSFYDNNDTEVAYFSDYKMYITNAHIKGNLTHGGYLCDSSNGLAWSWAGRE